jgi:hypothetical protein
MIREREFTSRGGHSLVLYATFNPKRGRTNRSGGTSPK